MYEPLEIFIKLQNHYGILDIIRIKTERLFSKGELSRRDIHQVYSGLYVDAVASFETFVENLFIDLLSNKVKYKPDNINCMIQFRNSVIARKIIFCEHSYLNWLPLQITQKRAKVYFNRCKTFNEIDGNDLGKIKYIVKIRHAIAHKSKFSLDVFTKDVIGSLSLLPIEKTPVGFLRSYLHPGFMRYQQNIIKLLEIARNICNNT